MKKIYFILPLLCLFVGFFCGWWVFDIRSQKKEIHLIVMDIANRSNNLSRFRDVISSEKAINEYEEILIFQLTESANVLGHVLMQSGLDLEPADRELLSSVLLATPELISGEPLNIDSFENFDGGQYLKEILEK